MCMSMYACAPSVPVACRGQKEHSGNSRSGRMGGCEPPCGFRAPNLGPLEVLITSGPTLQPYKITFKM